MTGTYSAGAQRVDVYARGFDFWDGVQAPERLSVSFSGDVITDITDTDKNQLRDLVRLDPMLIDSINPNQGEDRVQVKLSDVQPMLPKGERKIVGKGKGVS